MTMITLIAVKILRNGVHFLFSRCLMGNDFRLIAFWAQVKKWVLCGENREKKSVLN